MDNKNNTDNKHYNNNNLQLLYFQCIPYHATSSQETTEMGNYQTRIIPVMPNPTQRLRDTGVNDRRPQRNRRSEKSRSCGINAILAYYNRL